MNNIFENGQKVHYIPLVGKPENGIVKSQGQNASHVFVVYHCDGNWENYQNYTAASTAICDLQYGWV